MTKTCGETFVNFDRKIHQVLFYLGQQTRQRKPHLSHLNVEILRIILQNQGCYCKKELLRTSLKHTTSNNNKLLFFKNLFSKEIRIDVRWVSRLNKR